MSQRSSTEDPWWVKALVLSLVAAFLGLILVLPLVSVFAEALRQGLGPALEAIGTPDAIASIKLTMLTRRWRCPSTSSLAWRRPGL